MENEHEQPVENLMESTMKNLREMIDANTVVGEPIEIKPDMHIVPISRLTFGFASGGSEFSPPRQNPEEGIYPFGGGSGAGVSVKPVAFLVIKGDSIRTIPLDQDNTYDRIVDSVPQVIDLIKNMLKDTSFMNKNCDNVNTTTVDSNTN